MIKVVLFLAVILFFACCLTDDFGNSFALFILSFIAFAIAAIIAIVRAVKATAEVAGEVIEFAFDLIEAVVTGIIDVFTVKEQVRQKVPAAFKMLIQEKKHNAIKVGIFNDVGAPICPMTIEGDGVGDDIRVGQTIYMYD